MNPLKAGFSLCLLIFFNVIGLEAARKNNQNARYFSVLCRVYNAASSTVGHIYDPKEAAKISDEIDVINASLSEDDWFSEIARGSAQDKLSEEFKEKNGEISTFWDRWTRAVQKVNSGDTQFQRLASGSPVVKVAREKLKRIEIQVAKVFEKMVAYNKSARLDELAGKLTQAIGEPGQDRKSKSRADLCGKSTPSAGEQAGNNLVLDFLCLCARDNGSSQWATGQECGPKAPGTSIGEWSQSGNTLQAANEQAAWEAIVSACGGMANGGGRGAGELRVALDRFWEALNEGGELSGGRQVGMLGATTEASISSGCTGNTASTQGACIYYGDQTAWSGLNWPAKLKDAATLLEGMDSNATAIQYEMSHLKMLQTRAEEVYEEAKAALDLGKLNHEKVTQNESQKQNSGSLVDKMVTQAPNSQGATTNPCFIMPWTLLI